MHVRLAHADGSRTRMPQYVLRTAAVAAAAALSASVSAVCASLRRRHARPRPGARRIGIDGPIHAAVARVCRLDHSSIQGCERHARRALRARPSDGQRVDVPQKDVPPTARVCPQLSPYRAGPDTKVGIVTFAADAVVLSPLVSAADAAALDAALASYSAAGQTSISDGLSTGLEVLSGPGSRASIGASRVMMLLSDGAQTVDGDDATAVSTASAIKTAHSDVEIFAVGFGGAVAATLEAIASSPVKAFGSYYLRRAASPHPEPLTLTHALPIQRSTCVCAYIARLTRMRSPAASTHANACTRAGQQVRLRWYNS